MFNTIFNLDFFQVLRPNPFRRMCRLRHLADFPNWGGMWTVGHH